MVQLGEGGWEVMGRLRVCFVCREQPTEVVSGGIEDTPLRGQNTTLHSTWSLTRMTNRGCRLSITSALVWLPLHHPSHLLDEDMEVDTGASLSLMSESTFKRI